MNTISDLWGAEQLPIRDGLYMVAGESYVLRVDAEVPEGFQVLEEFDLGEWLRANPDELTWVYVTHTIKIDSGYLCCGEGSYGSEGFFARLDTSERLVWAVYLEESNPFVEISIDDNRAIFKSSSGITVTVDLEDPIFNLRK
ncbi:hypothetical protein [Saccharopolyspora sp. NPDC002376]